MYMEQEQAVARVNRLMLLALSEGAFPGAALAFGTSEYAFVRTYGVTSSLPGGTHVSPSTIYDLASLTKLFTATAALQLLEQGELRLDDPVGRFLPAFTQGDKGELRLRHLLTHTSGLPAHRPFFESCEGQDEMLRAVAREPLEYKPGTQVVYSCLGFITLASVVQTVAGQRLDSFLREHLFLPLGMRSTGFGPINLPREQVAPTEECTWRGELVWGAVHDENAYAQGGVSGNAGLFSNAPDLVRFAQMMLRQGVSEGGRVLSPATIRAATRSYTPGLSENRGLGWQLRSNEYPWCGDLAPFSSFGHTGFTGTSLWVSPEDDLFVVLLTNRVHPTRNNTQHIRYRPLIHNLLIAALSEQSLLREQGR